MFEYGEAHFQSLLVNMKDTWADLPAVRSSSDDIPFQFHFSEAVAGIELVARVKERMGDL